MLRPRGQTALEAKILASASSIWPWPGLSLVNLASKMCYPMQNNIGCISISWLYHCSIQNKYEVKHSNVGHKFSYMLSWHCRRVLLFRNIYMWPASASKTWSRLRGTGLDLGLRILASALTFWPALTSLIALCENHVGHETGAGIQTHFYYWSYFILLQLINCDMYCPLKQ